MMPFLLAAAAKLYNKGMDMKNRMNTVKMYNETQDVHKKMNGLNDTEDIFYNNFDWANVNKKNMGGY